jgi:hypothetical protein
VNAVGVVEITFQNRTRRFASDHRIGPQGKGAAGKFHPGILDGGQ